MTIDSKLHIKPTQLRALEIEALALSTLTAAAEAWAPDNSPEDGLAFTDQPNKGVQTMPSR